MNAKIDMKCVTDFMSKELLHRFPIITHDTAAVTRCN